VAAGGIEANRPGGENCKENNKYISVAAAAQPGGEISKEERRGKEEREGGWAASQKIHQRGENSENQTALWLSENLATSCYHIWRSSRKALAANRWLCVIIRNGEEMKISYCIL